MFSVQLRNGSKGVERYESHFRVFNDNEFDKAIDFAIKHSDYFMCLMYHNGDICRYIYNKITSDGNGGFDLILECERLG